jgi:hypothetical protein
MAQWRPDENQKAGDLRCGRCLLRFLVAVLAKVRTQSVLKLHVEHFRMPSTDFTHQQHVTRQAEAAISVTHLQELVVAN